VALVADPCLSALEVKGEAELVVVPAAWGAAGFDQLAGVAGDEVEQRQCGAAGGWRWCGGPGGKEWGWVWLGVAQEELDESGGCLGELLIEGAAAWQPAVAGGVGVSTDDDGVVAVPAEVDLLSLAVGAEDLGWLAGGGLRVAGVPVAAAAQFGPEVWWDGVGDLEAAIPA